MEARILSLPTPIPVTPTAVRVDGERIVVERLVLADPALAASLAERDPDDLPALVERALRIGLLALQDAATSVDVDVVRREFEKLVAQATAVNEHATRAVEEVLRANFADGDGRLPRTLEHFLGDRGALRQFVNELFDETRRDSAIGRIGGLLGRTSTATGARSPSSWTRPGWGRRSTSSARRSRRASRASTSGWPRSRRRQRARADERARSAAKGGDFELLLHGMLGDLARGGGDLLDRTGTETGSLLGSKKGDFVLTLNTGVTRGADVRVVLEAKDRSMSQRAMREELREARENRGAAVAVAVWTPLHAPTGIAPFALVGDDVHVVVDPEAPDVAYLEAAVRLARLLAISTLEEREVDVDAAAIGRALAGVREQLEAIRALKTQLTSVSNATKAVWTGLETMKTGILARVAEAEAELRVAQAATAR